MGSRVNHHRMLSWCCLGSQYSVFLDMMEGLLFQGYPSSLQGVSHCTCDTSAGPGLGSSVPAARVSSGGSEGFLVEGQSQLGMSRTWLHASLTVVSRFFFSNFTQAADHPCGGRSPGSRQPGMWSPGQTHGQCRDSCWLRKASG